MLTRVYHYAQNLPRGDPNVSKSFHEPAEEGAYPLLSCVAG